MGIPGLATKAQEYLKLHSPKFYHGGDFWIDGLNYIHGITDHVSGNSHKAPLWDFERRFLRMMKVLMDFQPNSVTFVIDAFVSESKFRIRLSRHIQRLRKLEPRQVLSATTLLVEMLRRHYPDIQVIYSGAEAEDEIMKLISEIPKSQHRRQFVWSDDSDLFTFPLHNASDVYIIPLRVQRPRPRQCSCICLQPVLAHVAIRARDMHPLPIRRPGFSIVNPAFPMRAVVEFVNCGKVYNKFFVVLGPVYTGNTLPPMAPHEIGAEIRRATYGIMIESNDFENPDQYEVLEYAQEGSPPCLSQKMRQPILGWKLSLVKQVLDTAPIVAIISNQFEQVQTKFQLGDHHIRAVERYIGDLLAGVTPVSSSKLADGARRLDALLKSLLLSLLYYSQSVGTTRYSQDLLLYRVTPWELSTYLVSSRDTHHIYA